MEPENFNVTNSAFWMAKVFGANSPITTCIKVTSENATINESIDETLPLNVEAQITDENNFKCRFTKPT